MHAATTTFLSTIHVLPYNDLLLYVNLIFYNFSKHIK